MSSHAAEPTWFIMNRESGCVSLAELRDVFPSLTDREAARWRQPAPPRADDAPRRSAVSAARPAPSGDSDAPH
jgi:hypothetical protein